MTAESKPAAGHGGRTSVRDVAQRAGVAVSTVSRVLTNHPNVSKHTREHVMVAVEELGYQPNALGQMLRRGATRTIGFAIGDISNPLFAQIALGAENALGEHGYSLLLSNSTGNPERERRNLELLEQRRVDGLLLSVTTERSASLLAMLERFDVPMVAIDRQIRSPAKIGSVCSHHKRGIAAAIESLHEAGHEHVALIAGLSTLRPGRQRAEAAVQTADSLGMQCTIVTGEGFAGPTRAEIAATLARPDRPTALIVGNNQLIGDVLDTLQAAGLTYPTDLSLVTCDEVPLLRHFKPRIATVRRDPYQLGQVAATMLIDRLHGSSNQSDVALPTSFDPADSIGPPP